MSERKKKSINPFNAVFESKRRHDAKRIELMHEVAAWTRGGVPVDIVLSKLAEARSALDDLGRTIASHRNVIASRLSEERLPEN